MALTPGTRFGVYDVKALIGIGGMGEVYRATDTNLARQVAIKVLPEAFAHDPDRLARFEREAKTLAALNHPNIAQIYGLERSGGTTALVMELVEGPTLAERIGAPGPRDASPDAGARLLVDEAIPIARQIALALEAAHEKGIIHRDLKPVNIKLRPDGVVKVLDFGLAKLNDPHVSNDSTDRDAFSNSPTLSLAATLPGMILGTAGYMSPEQARGKPVDKRADIWAFGAVLFEMLTGQRAFPGEDVTDTLAAVVRSEPKWEALPSTVSPTLQVFLRRCLHKDPNQRVGDIRDVRLALEGAFDTAASSSAASPRGRLTRIAALTVAAVVIAALGVPALRHLRETAPVPPPETRADISTPPTANPTSFALSPDGRQLVFVATEDGASRLWLRPLGATSADPLPGTEGAFLPFWSPDSKSVAFFADAKLKRIDVGGGRSVSIADAATGRGGTWNAEGVILFVPTNTSPLFRVPASGGATVAVTTLDRQAAHRFPFFLPDGRQFLFSAGGTGTARMETGGIYLGSMDSAETYRLATADTARAAYLPSGWLLWVRDGALVAQRLDVEARTLTGDPVTLADSVTVDGALAGALSVSATGLVAYRAGGAAGQRQLTWFDRSGKALGVVGAADDSGLSRPGLSRDGRRALVTRTVQGNADIWILDGTRTTRFTFDASTDHYPLWSPDASRIVFDSDRKGRHDLYLKPANGAGSEDLLLESAQNKVAWSWSPDGRALLYGSTDLKTGSDLWVLPLDGDRKPSVFLSTPFDERTGEFSPDGRWVAYQSTESGRYEIYVRPFPGPGGQWQVSTLGGVQPRWRPDGKELYYVAPDGTLMAVAVSVNGAAFEPGVPVALFQPRIWGGGTSTNNGQQYDVAADGRFLINVTTGDESTAPITLLMNWRPPTP